jgi:hypothetical protein
MNPQDAILSAAAAKASYATGATTAVLGLTVGDWAALIGIGATAVTFVANLWFRWRLDRRQERELEMRLKGVSTATKTSDNTPTGENP